MARRPEPGTLPFTILNLLRFCSSTPNSPISPSDRSSLHDKTRTCRGGGQMPKHVHLQGDGLEHADPASAWGSEAGGTGGAGGEDCCSCGRRGCTRKFSSRRGRGRGRAREEGCGAFGPGTKLRSDRREPSERLVLPGLQKQARGEGWVQI